MAVGPPPVRFDGQLILPTHLNLPVCHNNNCILSCTCTSAVTDAAIHAMGCSPRSHPRHGMLTTQPSTPWDAHHAAIHAMRCSSRAKMRIARHTLILHGWQRITSGARCYAASSFDWRGLRPPGVLHPSGPRLAPGRSQQPGRPPVPQARLQAKNDALQRDGHEPIWWYVQAFIGCRRRRFSE
jgi:hypothetical protein